MTVGPGVREVTEAFSSYQMREKSAPFCGMQDLDCALVSVVRAVWVLRDAAPAELVSDIFTT